MLAGAARRMYRTLQRLSAARTCLVWMSPTVLSLITWTFAARTAVESSAHVPDGLSNGSSENVYGATWVPSFCKRGMRRRYGRRQGLAAQAGFQLQVAAPVWWGPNAQAGTAHAAGAKAAVVRRVGCATAAGARLSDLKGDGVGAGRNGVCWD